jgi:hypothetical protein
MSKKNNTSFVFDDFIYSEDGRRIPIPNHRALSDINTISNLIINEMRLITGCRPDKLINRLMKITDLTRTLLFVLNGHKSIEGLPDLVEYETGIAGVVFSNEDRHCNIHDYDLAVDVQIPNNEPDRSLD